jgi:hypothetical protein
MDADTAALVQRLGCTADAVEGFKKSFMEGCTRSCPQELPRMGTTLASILFSRLTTDMMLRFDCFQSTYIANTIDSLVSEAASRLMIWYLVHRRADSAALVDTFLSIHKFLVESATKEQHHDLGSRPLSGLGPALVALPPRTPDRRYTGERGSAVVRQVPTPDPSLSTMPAVAQTRFQSSFPSISDRTSNSSMLSSYRPAELLLSAPSLVAATMKEERSKEINWITIGFGKEERSRSAPEAPPTREVDKPARTARRRFESCI